MSYTPTNWQTGDTVTAERLNKIEGAITEFNSEIDNATFITKTNEIYARFKIKEITLKTIVR